MEKIKATIEPHYTNKAVINLSKRTLSATEVYNKGLIIALASKNPQEEAAIKLLKAEELKEYNQPWTNHPV